MAQQATFEAPLSSSFSSQETPRASESALEDPDHAQKAKGTPSDYDFEDGPEHYDQESSGEMLIDPRQEMEREKRLYPGASTWAESEERLFEILYLRQDLPLLPSHWDFDFRGIPMPETLFAAPDESQHVVYAHERGVVATKSLIRLIDLTSNVRAAVQSGVRHKAPKHLEDGLEQYLKWAAQDGGYQHRRPISNIFVDVIDLKMDQEDITQYMQLRMQSWAKLQREFLRLDRDPEFWLQIEPALKDPETTKEALALERKRMQEEEKRAAAEDLMFLDVDNVATEASTTLKIDVEGEKPRTSKKRAIEMDEPLRSDGSREGNKSTAVSTEAGFVKCEPEHFQETSLDRENSHKKLKIEQVSPTEFDAEIPETSQTPDSPHPPSKLKYEDNVIEEPETPSEDGVAGAPQPEIEYTHEPPVVYGLFILNTSVFLLTVDSAKGDNGYVSFHVEMDFLDKKQSVWNALTVAIVACRARDELRARMDDFEILPPEPQSDLDE